MPEIPKRVKWVDGEPVPLDECEQHALGPRNYAAWNEWAEQMEETHVQRQCKGCGLWAVWEPKPEVTGAVG